VVVDLPKDVQEGELDYPENITIDLPGYKPTKKGHPLQVKKAAELILNSKKPVILAGGGVIHSSSSEELQHLSEIIGAPVTTSLMGKGCFPEDHSLSLGMLGMHGRMASNMMVDECDCLIAVGCRFSDRTTGDVNKFASNAEIIHIDVDPAEIGKNIAVNVPIVGDAKIILSHLIRIISQTKTINNHDWTDYVKSFRASCMPRLSFDDIPLKPQQVIKEISEAVTDDTIITFFFFFFILRRPGNHGIRFPLSHGSQSSHARQ